MLATKVTAWPQFPTVMGHRGLGATTNCVRPSCVQYYIDSPPDATQQALLTSEGKSWELIPRPTSQVASGPTTVTLAPKQFPPDMYQAGWYAVCQPTAGIPPDPACVAKLNSVPSTTQATTAQSQITLPATPAALPATSNTNTTTDGSTSGNTPATTDMTAIGPTGFEVIIGILGIGLAIMAMGGKHER
jgi:hypothetical protein